VETFDTRCPNCGSRLLVVKLRVGMAFAGRPADDLYRCYRCFEEFTPESDAEPVG